MRLFLFAAMLASCGPRDPAERAYFAALNGQKSGMPVAQQEALISQAIELEPTRSWYWELRAGLRVDTRDLAGALADYDRAIVLADRAYLRFARGLTLCRMGRLKYALPEFDLAIERQPENLQFYRGRGLARAETGDLKGARADAAFLEVKAPKSADGPWLMGRVEELSGRCREAVPFYEKALSVRPELVYPREGLVRCLRQAKMTRQADAQSAELAKWKASEAGCAACQEPFRY